MREAMQLMIFTELATLLKTSSLMDKQFKKPSYPGKKCVST